MGHEELATDLLTQAIAMAQPGGFLRLFVDMGPAIGQLLNRVQVDEETLRYVGEIQAALSGVLNTLYEFHVSLVSVKCLDQRD